MLHRLRLRLHDLLHQHYRFEQGTVEFYICAQRLGRREPEYVVMWPGCEPIRVTREQFVNLERRFDIDAPPGGLVPLDEAAAALDVDLARLEDEENDDA